MDQSSFLREMRRVKYLISIGERPAYWAGYKRGVQRRYHGDNFGTLEEHELWMSLKDDKDIIKAERGRGYFDGYSV